VILVPPDAAECYVPNCAQCSTSLTGCERCNDNLLRMEQDKSVECVPCPVSAGYFINNNSGTCLRE
jgi:hypothetical protein